MSSLSIDENIKIISDTMSRLKEQTTSMEREFYRHEGMMVVFDNLKKLGVENISIPVKVNNQQEVIDNVPVSNDGQEEDAC
tara:strand:- start:10839 stop:11081 length:243 start_codon:yes stop_codon:yes gene_type:complete